MNIKTITCHDVYNYGASLQAFALQKYLIEQGYNCEIIDFKPYYQQERYNLFYVGITSKYYNLLNRFPVLKLIYGPIKNYRILKTYKRKKAFDLFKKNFLKLTQQHYENSNELKNNPPIADIYIAGSDQIWNTDIPNGTEPAYYLEFGKKDIIRASYAASFGVSSIPENLKEFIKNKISDFSYISIREKTARKILSDLNINDFSIVVDPVFLLNKSEWINLFIKPRKDKEKYILVYDFTDDIRIKKTAQILKEQTNYKIYSLNDWKTLNYADKNINNAGPIEFLNFIYYADYIVCNSFHGTAFSIIFEKNFFSFSITSQKTSSRIFDLLDTTNLLSRYNIEENKINSIPIEYNNLGLEKHIKYSKHFISRITSTNDQI